MTVLLLIDVSRARVRSIWEKLSLLSLFPANMPSGGVEVDSPKDAAALHRQIFANERQAQKAFEREGFKRQIPIRDTHRGMSLKYAAYRRPGRGRCWADANWLDGDEQAAHARLTTAIGALAEWRPR